MMDFHGQFRTYNRLGERELKILESATERVRGSQPVEIQFSRSLKHVLRCGVGRLR